MGHDLICNYDEYGEVINGTLTFFAVAEALRMFGRAFIGWTDQNDTHLDIMFTKDVPFDGVSTIQGGIKPNRDLFVSIMRVGAFGFNIENADTDAGYFEEKLSPGRSLGSTKYELADLINGVKKQMVV